MAVALFGRAGLFPRTRLDRPRALLGATRANLRALAKGGRLAPGSLRPPTAAELADERYLLKRSERHGPVFKAWLGGKVTTCLIGIPLGRRFLAECEDRIESATPDLKPVFPQGFLRQMQGETHAHYRKLFAEALRAADYRAHEKANRQSIDRALSAIAAEPQPAELGGVRDLVRQASTETLFRMVLGVEPGWHGHDRLAEAFRAYAPDGTFVSPAPQQIAAYGEMSDLLTLRAGEIEREQAAPSMLASIVSSGELDDTAVGNLLHMTETGQFDLTGLWCWILTMLGRNPAFADGIAAEGDARRRDALCTAVVQETLRLAQSEYVTRRATQDIVFEGFLIPKRTMVRIAVWEAHKDPGIFEEPFRFDPMRFVDQEVPAERYAPLGIGKMRCLGGGWVIALSSLFVRQIVSGFRIETVGPGGALRGRFHFEPSDRLMLRRREHDGLAARN